MRDARDPENGEALGEEALRNEAGRVIVMGGTTRTPPLARMDLVSASQAPRWRPR